jgi:hypothetical protein
MEMELYTVVMVMVMNSPAQQEGISALGRGICGQW